MIYSVVIPKEREKILTNDFIDLLKERLKVEIRKNGNEIEVIGEGLEAYQCVNIIKAIGRGFDKEEALLLLEENNVLEIIEIPGNENARYRIRARIIGKNGLVKRNIERYTKCKLSIYGKTVSIIGPIDKIEIARTAIEMLISGKKHSTMYKYFEKLRREGVLE